MERKNWILGKDFVSSEFFQIDKAQVTPELAKKLLTRNIDNRSLNRRHVLDLANAMKRGKWVFNGDAIKFNVHGDMINGQHTCSAVIESGVTIEMNIQFGLPMNSFVTMDSGIKTRGASDVFKLNGIQNYTTISSIIRRELRLMKNFVVSGTNISSSTGYKGETNQDFLDKYGKNPDDYKKIAKFSVDLVKRSNHVMVPSMIGGYYSYLKFEKHWGDPKIKLFFKQLLDKDDTNSPVDKNIRLLRNKLIQDKLESLSGGKKLNTQKKQAYIVKTWNAYVSGKVLKNLQYDIAKEKFPEFNDKNK